jgi:small subunit ribosomal protein S2
MDKKDVIKRMLDHAVHFGHRTHKWNPLMKKYIYGQRKGIHIFDLEKTYDALGKAVGLLKKAVSEGKVVLFVGTKPQAYKIITEAATKCQMPYVAHKWVGGLLTNYATIKKRIDYLKKLKAQDGSGELEKYTKKEVVEFRKQINKLEAALGGLESMEGVPDILFAVDAVRDDIAVKEANRLGIPVIAVTDSNADPSKIDYVLPGNDDAISSLEFFVGEIANAIEGSKKSKSPKN